MSQSNSPSKPTVKRSLVRRWLQGGLVLLLLTYWLLLITATHLPKVPQPLNFRPSDKLLHFVAYAILGLLVGSVYSLGRRLSWTSGGWLLLGLAIHGALDEVTQPLFGRYAEVADWWADIAGAALGLGLAALICGKLRQRRSKPEVNV